MNYTRVKNNQSIPVISIPIMAYDQFLELNSSLLKDSNNHCVNYFGYLQGKNIKLICCIANDLDGDIFISSSEVNGAAELPSLTGQNLAFNGFERELHENFGLRYLDHPWLKPLRYSFDRANQRAEISNYPFYKISSEELHEVGVGPIHAGIIEPGHFRFICNGEQILHLEIQLGYQHRGIESLFLKKTSLLQRSTLAESICGDTTVGHATAFANIWESLCQHQADEALQFDRTVALELERIAMHIGDLSAMCTDIAYQLGSAGFGRLRTPMVNFFQEWCGNRLAKGLIRPFKSNFAFTGDLGVLLNKTFDDFIPDFDELRKKTFSQPSVLARLERTGIITNEHARSLGLVGMIAKTVGLPRDIRLTHPHGRYQHITHSPILKHHGDDYSRSQVREEEITQSIGYLRNLLQNIPKNRLSAKFLSTPEPDSFTISLVEGWRGEICHCAVTDKSGNLLHYKIKDPSFHNWIAVALSVRNNEISDFPICNKSFNLSYCGHDL